MAEGHDAVRVTDLGADPGDAAILERARRERRILITMDKDFGALLFKERLTHSGLIRLPHGSGQDQIRLMAELIDRHGGAELEGAVVTVRGTRARIASAGA